MRFSLFTAVFFLFLHAPAMAGVVCPSRYQVLFNSYEAKDPFALPMTVGIELEGSLESHPNLSQLAYAMLRKITERYPNAIIIPDRVRGIYQIKYQRSDGVVKKWHVVHDRSVEAVGLTPEIVSPILDSPADFASFRQVVQVARDLGIQEEPRSGGVHVHIGFGDAQAGEIAALGAVFKEIEKDLIRVFSMLKTRNDFARPTSEELFELIRSAPMDDEGALAKMIGAQDRYRMLNLEALIKHKTVEFRLFNSTFDLEAVELMHDFSSKLVHAIRTKNPALVRYLTEERGEIELAKIARILNMKIAKPKSRKILERIAHEARRSMGPALMRDPNSQPFLNLAVLLGVLGVTRSISDGVDALD